MDIASADGGLLDWSHGLIKYKDTKTKFRLYLCLIEFIDWRYSQSCWYCRPSFVNYCSSNLLFGSPPPLPKVQVQYIQTVCGWEGVVGGGGCWVVLETIFCRSLTPLYLARFRTYKIASPPPNRNLGGEGGLRQTATKSLYKAIFFRCRHLALLSISLIFLTLEPVPPQTKTYEGKGPHTENYLPQSPFTGQLFLDADIWHCFLSV